VARAPAFEEALLWANFDSATRQWNAPDWPVNREDSPDATVYAALVRGVGDYARKNGFEGALLGLSGGIDSALTLAVAVDALGQDRVTAVMLPSRYTSSLSLREARAQAQRLQVRYLDLPVGDTCDAFSRSLAAVCGEPADITAQNLQARSRGVLLMALSNQTGKLLLATGNKSEAAVGYATLYGDMCGGYAPLADVYKTQVYELARWRNQAATGGWGLGSGPVISRAVIERAPSAELRADQTDQDSLPAYAVLDGILQRCIEGGQSPADIVAAGYAADDVERVLRMLHANEFKRRQAALGPRVSTCAFGREWHWPISNAWR
jgi:NAD+ synthase (glutamine-hydrolysing)